VPKGRGLGTGSPKREFLYSDDLADACVFRWNATTPPMWRNYNIGVARVTIREAAELFPMSSVSAENWCSTTQARWHTAQAARCSRLQALGWQAKTGFREGITRAYADFLQNVNKAA
jgi:GDP-L-fucose synthase